MESCFTSQWVKTAPQMRLDVSAVNNSDNTTSSVNWRLYYVASYAANTSVAKAWTVVVGSTEKSGTYDIDGKTGEHLVSSGSVTVSRGTSAQSIACKVTVAWNLSWSGNYKGSVSASTGVVVSARPRYTIKFSSNGGTGGPGSINKWYGIAVKIPSTKPTRTGHTFLGWSTSASATTSTYSAGGNYTGNANVTLYAVWKAITYTIKFCANGGTGAPSSVTKTYGVTLKLPSTIPTKTNRKFLGWTLNPAALTSTVSAEYSAGSNYTVNASGTLYAVWELTYRKPTIVNVEVYRCDANGTKNDSGSMVYISYDWTIVAVDDVKFKNSIVGGLSQELGVLDAPTSGTRTNIFNPGITLDPEVTYTVEITVSDSVDSFTVQKSLPGAVFPIDIKAGGNGVAFGKAAELDGFAEFAYGAKFNGPVQGKVVGMDALPEIPLDSDLNDYLVPGTWACYRNYDAATIVNIPVTKAGRLEVWSSTGEGVRDEKYSYMRQRYIPYHLDDPTWERDIIRGADNVWVYGDWLRTTLSSEYSEIVYHGQQMLWNGAYYMNAEQTITLNQNVSDQSNGIVLVFSWYADGAADNSNFRCFFVPKRFVRTHSGKGYGFTMFSSDFGVACNKYLYIYDNMITGHANNQAEGTGACGITYNNKQYVLRYVIGV